MSSLRKIGSKFFLNIKYGLQGPSTELETDSGYASVAKDNNADDDVDDNASQMSESASILKKSPQKLTKAKSMSFAGLFNSFTESIRWSASLMDGTFEDPSPRSVNSIRIPRYETPKKHQSLRHRLSSSRSRSGKKLTWSSRKRRAAIPDYEQDEFHSPLSLNEDTSNKSTPAEHDEAPQIPLSMDKVGPIINTGEAGHVPSIPKIEIGPQLLWPLETFQEGEIDDLSANLGKKAVTEKPDTPAYQLKTTIQKSSAMSRNKPDCIERHPRTSTHDGSFIYNDSPSRRTSGLREDKEEDKVPRRATIDDNLPRDTSDLRQDNEEMVMPQPGFKNENSVLVGEQNISDLREHIEEKKIPRRIFNGDLNNYDDSLGTSDLHEHIREKKIPRRIFKDESSDFFDDRRSLPSYKSCIAAKACIEPEILSLKPGEALVASGEAFVESEEASAELIKASAKLEKPADDLGNFSLVKSGFIDQKMTISELNEKVFDATTTKSVRFADSDSLTSTDPSLLAENSSRNEEGIAVQVLASMKIPRVFDEAGSDTPASIHLSLGEYKSFLEEGEKIQKMVAEISPGHVPSMGSRASWESLRAARAKRYAEINGFPLRYAIEAIERPSSEELDEEFIEGPPPHQYMNRFIDGKELLEKARIQSAMTRGISSLGYGKDNNNLLLTSKGRIMTSAPLNKIDEADSGEESKYPTTPESKTIRKLREFSPIPPPTPPATPPEVKMTFWLLSLRDHSSDIQGGRISSKRASDIAAFFARDSARQLALEESGHPDAKWEPPGEDSVLRLHDPLNAQIKSGLSDLAADAVRESARRLELEDYRRSCRHGGREVSPSSSLGDSNQNEKENKLLENRPVESVSGGNKPVDNEHGETQRVENEHGKTESVDFESVDFKPLVFSAVEIEPANVQRADNKLMDSAPRANVDTSGTSMDEENSKLRRLALRKQGIRHIRKLQSNKRR